MTTLMQPDEHLREVAAWLVHMASIPMAKEHAKHREAELMHDYPAMYADLPRYVRQEIEKRRA